MNDDNTMHGFVSVRRRGVLTIESADVDEWEGCGLEQGQRQYIINWP
jgi:hypothetical protein